MIDFLSRTNGMVKTLTMGSYGFPSIKPTDIFTNALNWQPLPMMPFGRGNKNPLGFDFSNLTVCQRQETPLALAESVQQFCSQHFNLLKQTPNGSREAPQNRVYEINSALSSVKSPVLPFRHFLNYR